MSKLKHVGVRPEYSVTKYDNKTYIEEKPCGGYRLWNDKTINSGCDKVLKKAKIIDGLIFCPWCGEMAAVNQFVKVESVK